MHGSIGKPGLMAVHLGRFGCLSRKLSGNRDLDITILRLLNELLKGGYFGLQLRSENPGNINLVNLPFFKGSIILTMSRQPSLFFQILE